MQKELHWQTANCYSIPKPLLEWILFPGSFIQRLREYGVHHPRIQVVNQRWAFPQLDEQYKLNMPSRSYALIREVLISSENKKWMFARTVFPRTTLTGRLQQLARLKSRSLGSVLFKDPHLERSDFEIAFLSPEQLWARRSVFTLQNKSLLLTELFLPDIQSL